MLFRLITLFFILLLQAGLLHAQSNIQVGKQAPAIRVNDWIANVPDDKSLDNKYTVMESRGLKAVTEKKDRRRIPPTHNRPVPAGTHVGKQPKHFRSGRSADIEKTYCIIHAG